jgi:hypothetical protein
MNNKNAYTRALYNLRQRQLHYRHQKENDHSFSFPGFISDEDKQLYHDEKIVYIHQDTQDTYDDDNDNDDDDIDSDEHKNTYIDPISEPRYWDISFTCSYQFPFNTMGFRGQWMTPALAPFAKYLNHLSHIESNHICYHPITDKISTLDSLCAHFYDNEHRHRHDHGDRKDVIDMYKEYSEYYEQNPNSYPPQISLESYRSKYEHEGVHWEHSIFRGDACRFSLPRTTLQFITKGEPPSIEITTYADIADAWKEVMNASSYLYKYIYNNDNKKASFYSLQDQWIELLTQLETHWSTIGHDVPWYAMYLHEDEQKTGFTSFEETRLLTYDGNEVEIIARSKHYFYYMQYIS